MSKLSGCVAAIVIALAAGIPADDALLVQLQTQEAPAEASVAIDVTATESAETARSSSSPSTLEKLSAESLLNRPNELYQELNKGRTEFETVIEQLRKENTEAIGTQKQLYEKKLHERYQENDKTATGNSALEARINDLKETNGKLRTSATQLSSLNTQLRRDLHVLHVNLTTAEEYLTNSLEALEDKDAPQLKVLHELDNQDSNAAADHAHSARLLGIGSFERKELSMLQESRPMPTDLIQKLQSDLSTLTQEEERSESSLKALFLKDYKAAVTRHAELTQRQEELTAIATGLTTLKQRLTEAVLHLEETHRALSDRLSSLRNYAQKLGVVTTHTEIPVAPATFEWRDEVTASAARAVTAKEVFELHDDAPTVSMPTAKQPVALTEESASVKTPPRSTLEASWQQKLSGLFAR